MPSAPLREEFSKLSVQFPSPQSEDQGLRGIHLVTMQQLPHTHTHRKNLILVAINTNLILSCGANKINANMFQCIVILSDFNFTGHT